MLYNLPGARITDDLRLVVPKGTTAMTSDQCIALAEQMVLKAMRAKAAEAREGLPITAVTRRIVT